MPAGRRLHPLAGLAIAALVPAAVLFGVWRVAASRVPPAPRPATVTLPPASSHTPLLSLRRLPATLARDVSFAAFQRSLQPLLDSLGDGACAAVNVDGQPAGAKNETVPLHPASSQKILVAAVALDVLGADYRYTTSVRGTLGEDGSVGGDLYLVGGGDPLLTNSWWKGPSEYPPFNTTSVEALAQSLVATGVRSVQGDVVGDASRYDDEWYAPTWAPAVRYVEGGPIAALVADDGRLSPSKAGENPPADAAQVLIDELTARGVAVRGVAKAGRAPAGAGEIASIRSQPLAAIVAEMLTTSDNNTAEMVLKEIGRHASGIGGSGTRDAGLAVVRATLQRWGVPLEGVSLLDGSGLSTESTVTCAAMLAVLRHSPALSDGMAVAGAKGGTLAATFSQPPLGGKLRAKTGTLKDGGVKALAGYLPVDGGGAVQFVLILNGAGVADQANYLPLWERLGSVIAGYPQGPTPAMLVPS